MRRVLLLIFWLGWSGTLFSQAKFIPVEKLTYTGYYNWGILWVKAGWVEFTMSESEKYPDAP